MQDRNAVLLSLCGTLMSLVLAYVNFANAAPSYSRPQAAKSPSRSDDRFWTNWSDWSFCRACDETSSRSRVCVDYEVCHDDEEQVQNQHCVSWTSDEGVTRECNWEKDSAPRELDVFVESGEESSNPSDNSNNNEASGWKCDATGECFQNLTIDIIDKNAPAEQTTEGPSTLSPEDAVTYSNHDTFDTTNSQAASTTQNDDGASATAQHRRTASTAIAAKTASTRTSKKQSTKSSPVSPARTKRTKLTTVPAASPKSSAATVIPPSTRSSSSAAGEKLNSASTAAASTDILTPAPSAITMPAADKTVISPSTTVSTDVATTTQPPPITTTTTAAAAATTPNCLSTDSPTGNTTFDQFQLDSLGAHNTLRSKHGSPPMTLNACLNAWAQDWADTLAKRPSCNLFPDPHRPANPNGQNVASVPNSASTASTAVDLWYGEIKDYDFKDPKFGPKTGHFTQVVWKDSVQLGIGHATCNGQAFVVAEYSPRGNMRDEFAANVMPRKD